MVFDYIPFSIKIDQIRLLNASIDFSFFYSYVEYFWTAIGIDSFSDIIKKQGLLGQP